MISTYPYVPLWCKSNFSFLEGASHPEELVEEAHFLGLRSLALTDRDGVYGIVRAHLKAEELGVKLIVGAEMTIQGNASLVLLVRNREGYANLCRLISTGRLRSKKGSSSVTIEEVARHAPGLIALFGGTKNPLARDQEPTRDIETLKSAFGEHLFALVVRHRTAEEKRDEARILARARQHDLRLAAACEVLYHTPARRPLQDVLTCIREKCRLKDAEQRTRPNAEHFLKPRAVFEALFDDLPSAIAKTSEIAEMCDFSLRHIRYRYPKENLPNGSTTSTWLRELTFKGAKKRYNGAHTLRQELITCRI
jgi:error-prone DNA polymerase